MGDDIKDGMNITSDYNQSGKKVTLTFKRGKHFLTTGKLGVAKFKIMPQIAVWLEDTSGRYLQTVYVTRCFGKQEWKYFKPDPDSCFRTMCMPYWFNRYKKAGNAAPTPKKTLPDAVTGATPTGNFTIDFTIPDSLKCAMVFTEWNSSFDNNDSFTKESVSFNGQPSIILSTRINLGDSVRTVDTLTLKGHGGNKGDDATLYTDTGKLTTAQSIFSLVTISRK
jgi:hypothetical protein